MSPARRPRPALLGRLLVVDPVARRFGDRRLTDLPGLLDAGDLVVVNDASTLPASLSGRAPSGRPIELRLLGARGGGRFRAVLFGEGDWRTPTEHRPAPERLAPGALLRLGGEPPLLARVEAVDPLSPRLVDLSFDRRGAELLGALYRVGRPVQYAHLDEPLAIAAVQTRYAARPWAVELPSAGRPLTIALLGRLRRAGIELAAVTHAAGLSSTGEPAIDRALPLPERFEVSRATAQAIGRTRAQGHRVVAVGTSTVRALESAARAGGTAAAAAGETDLRIGPGFHPRVAAGLLTGLHDPGTSHFDLLSAFAPPALLRDALAHADAHGYLGHEFGDSCLILPGAAQRDLPSTTVT